MLGQKGIMLFIIGPTQKHTDETTLGSFREAMTIFIRAGRSDKMSVSVCVGLWLIISHVGRVIH